MGADSSTYARQHSESVVTIMRPWQAGQFQATYKDDTSGCRRIQKAMVSKHNRNTASSISVRLRARYPSKYGHTGCRHFVGGSSAEPNDHKQFCALLNGLLQPYVQTAGTDVVKQCIGYEL